jgi:hypothetical protein
MRVYSIRPPIHLLLLSPLFLPNTSTSSPHAVHLLRRPTRVTNPESTTDPGTCLRTQCPSYPLYVLFSLPPLFVRPRLRIPPHCFRRPAPPLLATRSRTQQATKSDADPAYSALSVCAVLFVYLNVRYSTQSHVSLRFPGAAHLYKQHLENSHADGLCRVRATEARWKRTQRSASCRTSSDSSHAEREIR